MAFQTVSMGATMGSQAEIKRVKLISPETLVFNGNTSLGWLQYVCIPQQVNQPWKRNRELLPLLRSGPAVLHLVISEQMSSKLLVPQSAP